MGKLEEGDAASAERLGQTVADAALAKGAACDTCAFGSSGGACDEAENAMKAQICAFGGIPFFCHHGRDGQEYDWRNDPLGPLALAPENRKLCEGWRSQVGVLKRGGYFPDRDMTYIRRVVAKRAFTLLERWRLDGIRRVKKKQVWAQLKRCMKFITAKDIGDMGIPL